MKVKLDLTLKKYQLVNLAQITVEGEINVLFERLMKKKAIQELIVSLEDAGLVGSVWVDGNKYRITNGDIDHLQIPLLYDPNFIISRNTNSKHEYVIDIQTFLLAQGYSEELEIDGIYGEKTEKAVIWFQEKNELDTDGIFGKETLLKLIQMAPN